MELIVSVGLLSCIVMIADIVMALQGNFPKILRVTLAAASYVAVLGFLLKSIGRFGAPPRGLPLWVFLSAGAAAGLVSSLVRTDVFSVVFVMTSTLTPTLLGAVHWIGLQRYAWIRARIVARPGTGKR